ncbi:YraN family protein [Bifidobacterium thermophilum]|uniref:YraN family protein n=1 Tax=Bifidobacterium thermophilum TaxID=33905 RepID=UPI00309FCB46
MDHNNQISSCSYPQAHGQAADMLARMRTTLLEPSTSTKALGAAGEQYAAYTLIARDWHLIAANWRTRYGEIDLIMLADDLTLVFVEVKTRRSSRFGSPQEAVHVGKQAALHKTARLWLNEHQDNRPYYHAIRFDVMSIEIGGGDIKVRHIPGAF